eukprot:PhM_4_TR16008/c0_g1_i1/m.54630/K20858/MCU; calcium uniporter protein, mitochondrial
MRRLCRSTLMMRSSAFAVSNATSSPLLLRHYHLEPTTADQMRKVAMYNYVRGNLRGLQLESIPETEFAKHCASAGLTPSEATECLERFAEAGLVVCNDGTVFLRPTKMIGHVHAAMELNPTRFDVAAALRSELEALQTELKDLEDQKAKLDAKAGAIRKRWWGLAALLSGFQMYVMSRFTFVDFDWDIMEPVSFFLTTGTALIFFVWFLLKRTEHTYERFDLALLPSRQRKLYMSGGFDYQRWKSVKTRVLEIEEELKKTDEWKQHRG